MQRDTVGSARPRLVDDRGAAAPTPLFVAYVVALALSAVATFRGGVDARAIADFVLLAATLTGAALVLFAALMIWATRGRQRASALAAARPGALVLRGTRARGLAAAVRALRSEVPFVPIGVTLLADHRGLEVWSGAAEHPVRLGRAPWDAVADVRVTHVTRFGRSTGGITVSVLDGVDGGVVELPFAVLGSGLGGLSVPKGPELELIVESLRDRRADSVHV